MSDNEDWKFKLNRLLNILFDSYFPEREVLKIRHKIASCLLVAFYVYCVAPFLQIVAYNYLGYISDMTSFNIDTARMECIISFSTLTLLSLMFWMPLINPKGTEWKFTVALPVFGGLTMVLAFSLSVLNGVLSWEEAIYKMLALLFLSLMIALIFFKENKVPPRVMFFIQVGALIIFSFMSTINSDFFSGLYKVSFSSLNAQGRKVTLYKNIDEYEKKLVFIKGTLSTPSEKFYNIKVSNRNIISIPKGDLIIEIETAKEAEERRKAKLKSEK